jgi:hypothetical protein
MAMQAGCGTRIFWIADWMNVCNVVSLRFLSYIFLLPGIEHEAAAPHMVGLICATGFDRIIK